jgi:hypothetical protein
MLALVLSAKLSLLGVGDCADNTVVLLDAYDLIRLVKLAFQTKLRYEVV